MSDRQIDTGSEPPQIAQERRRQNELGVIRHAQHKARACSSRIKGPVEAQDRFDLSQSFLDWFGDLARACGRLDPARRSQEQLIGERLTQTGQGIAGRGLRQSQPHGGARNAALAIDEMENPQKIEIDHREVHHSILI